MPHEPLAVGFFGKPVHFATLGLPGSRSTAAALHFAASTQNFKIQENFNDFGEPYVKQAVTGLPEVVDGYFPLPEGPGLGVALNDDVIRAHPRQKVHFNLFSEDWHKRDVAEKED